MAMGDGVRSNSSSPLLAAASSAASSSSAGFDPVSSTSAKTGVAIVGLRHDDVAESVAAASGASAGGGERELVSSNGRAVSADVRTLSSGNLASFEDKVEVRAGIEPSLSFRDIFPLVERTELPFEQGLGGPGVADSGAGKADDLVAPRHLPGDDDAPHGEDDAVPGALWTNEESAEMLDIQPTVSARATFDALVRAFRFSLFDSLGLPAGQGHGQDEVVCVDLDLPSSLEGSGQEVQLLHSMEVAASLLQTPQMATNGDLLRGERLWVGIGSKSLSGSGRLLRRWNGGSRGGDGGGIRDSSSRSILSAILPT